MTTQKIHQVRETVLIALESLQVEVLIMDVKYSYGRQRYLVSPVCGRGQQWIDSQRIINSERTEGHE